MKTMLAKVVGLSVVLLLAVFIQTGCKTGDGTTDTGGFGFNCETAQKAYATYQAIIQAGVYEPSEDEVKVAKAAGVFLNVFCGWTHPAATKAAKSSLPKEDKRGVLILVP